MTAHIPLALSASGFRVLGTLVVVCACAVPLVSDQQPQPQQLVVVSVSGDWTRIRRSKDPGDKTADRETDADLQRPVRFGQTLNAGAICLLGSEPGSIVLKYSAPDEDKLYPFPCEKANIGGPPSCPTRPQGTCRVDLQRVRDKTGIRAWLGVSFTALLSVVSAQPDKYMVAASRGGESELADGVVPLEDGRIDLRAIFRDLDPGTYDVEMAPLASLPLQGPPLRVVVAKGQAARIETRGAAPGVYNLSLVTEKGEPGDSACWVLVASPPDYAKQSAAFARAVSEAAKFPEEMDPSATRALLRAYMESLASAKQGAARP